jgi:bacteriocin-like protein
MNDDKIDPDKKGTQISSADDLAKTKKGDAELSEEELKRVSGGLTIELKEVLISGQQISGGGGGSVPDK